jgi:hypothetical protein
MFLRCKVRRKDGKHHRYWSVVENTRVAGGRVVFKRSIAPSNGMDAKSSAQSAMPSIAFLTATVAARRLLSTKAAAPALPQLQSRISTTLTDVTFLGYIRRTEA